MKSKTRLLLLAAFIVLALPLVFTGTASAKYMSDGAVPDGAGGWKTPNDGICVVGLHTDGTMDVADGITSKRDCIYLNKGTMNGGTPFDLKSLDGWLGVPPLQGTAQSMPIQPAPVLTAAAMAYP